MTESAIQSLANFTATRFDQLMRYEDGRTPLYLTEEQYNAIRDLVAQASAAPEQEPFAYGLTLNGESRAVSLVATQWGVLERHGAKTVPLYTHADDGELERLRAELAESDKCVMRALNERDAALKQLAKAQALLRESCYLVTIYRDQLVRDDAEPEDIAMAEQILADIATALACRCGEER